MTDTTPASATPDKEPVETPITYTSKRWGVVNVVKSQYHSGALAIVLMTQSELDGYQYMEPLAKLSVYFDESDDLPPGCFFAKEWSENEEIAAEAMESGLFKRRDDLPSKDSGWIVAPVWELLK